MADSFNDTYNLVRKKKTNDSNVVTKSTIEKLYPVGSVCKYVKPMSFEHGVWDLTSTDGGVYTYKRVYEYTGWLEGEVGEGVIPEFLSYLNIEEETLDRIIERVLSFNFKDGDNFYIENSNIFAVCSLTESHSSHVADAFVNSETDITLTFNHRNGAEDIAHIYIKLKGGVNGSDESVDIDYDKNFNYLVDKENNICNNDGQELENEVRNLTLKASYLGDLIFNKTGENNMTTLQTVNVTLVDNNPNLRGEAKIVFKKHNHLTEYGVEDTKMNIISEGGVKEALIKHNTEVRLKTVDKDIQRSTGRDVMLEPIELLSDSDLEWRYVVIG